jgi:hypothetical protein
MFGAAGQEVDELPAEKLQIHSIFRVCAIADSLTLLWLGQ